MLQSSAIACAFVLRTTCVASQEKPHSSTGPGDVPVVSKKADDVDVPTPPPQASKQRMLMMRRDAVIYNNLRKGYQCHNTFSRFCAIAHLFGMEAAMAGVDLLDTLLTAGDDDMAALAELRGEKRRLSSDLEGVSDK
eukprot:6485784-Amphidinium_carterae.1